jgi:hypothetical protein
LNRNGPMLGMAGVAGVLAVTPGSLRGLKAGWLVLVIAPDEPLTNQPSTGPSNPELGRQKRDVRSPMEAHGSYRGDDWSPERLMFHQNLESFADQVGLIVGLQANGKMSQDEAYAKIKKIWKGLKFTRSSLFDEATD